MQWFKTESDLFLLICNCVEHLRILWKYYSRGNCRNYYIVIKINRQLKHLSVLEVLSSEWPNRVYHSALICNRLNMGIKSKAREPTLSLPRFSLSPSEPVVISTDLTGSTIYAQPKYLLKINRLSHKIYCMLFMIHPLKKSSLIPTWFCDIVLDYTCIICY